MMSLTVGLRLALYRKSLLHESFNTHFFMATEQFIKVKKGLKICCIFSSKICSSKQRRSCSFHLLFIQQHILILVSYEMRKWLITITAESNQLNLNQFFLCNSFNNSNCHKAASDQHGCCWKNKKNIFPPSQILTNSNLQDRTLLSSTHLISSVQ